MKLKILMMRIFINILRLQKKKLKLLKSQYKYKIIKHKSIIITPTDKKNETKYQQITFFRHL